MTCQIGKYISFIVTVKTEKNNRNNQVCRFHISPQCKSTIATYLPGSNSFFYNENLASLTLMKEYFDIKESTILSCWKCTPLTVHHFLSYYQEPVSLVWHKDWRQTVRSEHKVSRLLCTFNLHCLIIHVDYILAVYMFLVTLLSQTILLLKSLVNLQQQHTVRMYRTHITHQQV